MRSLVLASVLVVGSAPAFAQEPRPNLTIENFNVSNLRPEVGTLIQVSYDLVNLGPGVAPLGFPCLEISDPSGTSWTYAVPPGPTTPLDPGGRSSRFHQFGAPTQAGQYTLRTRADCLDSVLETNESDNIAAVSLTVLVYPLEITTTQLPEASLDRTYFFYPETHGGAPPVVLSVSEPSWLTIDLGGTLRGLPPTAGVVEVRLRAASADGQIASAVLPLLVVERALNFVTAADLPAAVVDEPYCRTGSVTIEVEGGAPPYRLEIADHSPPGLVFDPVAWTVCGTPKSVGLNTFTLHLEDSAGASVDKRFILSILPAPLVIPDQEVPRALVGRYYQHRLIAAGGQPPYRFAAEFGLPPGLVLAEDGTLEGTPTAPRLYSLGLLLVDSSRVPVRGQLPLLVESDAPPPSLPESSPTGCQCFLGGAGSCGAALLATIGVLAALELGRRRRRLR